MQVEKVFGDGQSSSLFWFYPSFNMSLSSIMALDKILKQFFIYLIMPGPITGQVFAFTVQLLTIGGANPE